MPEVFIDGESIRFEGPAPVSLERLVDLIAPALGDSGRVLSSITIDGAPCGDSVSAETFQAARRVELSSMTMAEAVAQVAKATGEAVAHLREEAGRLATDVLRSAWSDCAPAVVAHTEGLGRLLQDFGSLGAQQTMGPVVESFADTVNQWMDTIATRDAGAICLSLDREILPQLSRLQACIKALEGSSSP